MNSTKDIIDISIQKVKDIYANSPLDYLHYHNWPHTELVWHHAKELASNTNEISELEMEALELAAVYHDVGHAFGSNCHEDDSANYAEKILVELNYPAENIPLIRSLILATKMGYAPKTELEKIIKDADLAHLKNDNYLGTTYCDLYKELKATHKKDMSQFEWAKMCYGFIKNHCFFTDFAQKNYAKGKQDNLKKIKNMLEETPAPIAPEVQVVKEKKIKKKKKKPTLPEKGVETMFRTALRNHMTLSTIADSKANTLISVNAIIISIVLSALFPKMDSNPFLIYPGLSLLACSIVVIIIAILSTVPKTTHGHLSRLEIEKKQGNLLFFGNFHKMELPDYEWGIGEIMEDKDYLYKTMTRDLFFLGKVLHKKYNLLRYAYYIFVGGLVISVAMFVFSMRAML
jgi:predicted metal-dependent HD superfamily phosphohydrolase